MPRMSQNARRVYDQKLEESKGPTFDLIGTGLAGNFGGPSTVVEPSSLFRKQNHSVGRTGVARNVHKGGSHSVRPPRGTSQKPSNLDFNLSGVNIPVLQNEAAIKANRPPLPGKRIRGPHKFKNDDLIGEMIIDEQNSQIPSNNRVDLSIGRKITESKVASSKSKFYFFKRYRCFKLQRVN